MVKIDPKKIELIDYFHNPMKNPTLCNPDYREISDYDCLLDTCAHIKDIDKLLSGIQSPEIKWIDYCCGRGTALTQGTYRFNRRNGGLVSSLGADIRRFDGKKYVDTPQFIQGQTVFYQHDLDEGVLETLKPDLITCIKGLLYTNDPLKGFERMYHQLNEGGCMLVTINTGNEVDYFRDLTTEMMGMLFDRADIVSRAVMFQKEVVVFLNKLRGCKKGLDFGLELEQSSRDPYRGWTRCNYTWREE
ncbi:MAG: hypothetical protein WC533_04500 [Candidatus Pacearchaeota archaeon]